MKRVDLRFIESRQTQKKDSGSCTRVMYISRDTKKGFNDEKYISIHVFDPDPPAISRV